jgi:hypothetical protein
MKKFIAVILALVLALSLSAVAFAEGDSNTSSTEKYTYCPVCGRYCGDGDTYNNCINSHRTRDGYLVCHTCGKEYYNIDNYLACEASHRELVTYTCATCGAVYSDKEAYNNHLETHYNNVNYHWSEYVGMTLPALMDQFVSYVQASGVMQFIIDIAYQVFDAVMAYMKGTGTEAEVAGATDKLDSALAGIDLEAANLTGIKDFITAIKQKVKDFYAHDCETVVEVTDAEAPVDTGSATAGIAAFAVIAAAAAAAYVCSKKKA